MKKYEWRFLPRTWYIYEDTYRAVYHNPGDIEWDLPVPLDTVRALAKLSGVWLLSDYGAFAGPKSDTQLRGCTVEATPEKIIVRSPTGHSNLEHLTITIWSKEDAET